MSTKIIFLLVFLFSNLAFSQLLFEDEATSRLVTAQTLYDGNGNGLSFADYNGDGLDDLTFPSGNGAELRFYENLGDIFREQRVISPAITYKTRSVSWVDYDNDGDKDLFVVSDEQGNRLYRQDANFLFTDVTISSGLFTDDVESFSVSWGDIDNDSCLDLFISNRTLATGITNYIFRNNCDGTFSNITNLAGLSQLPRLTFGASFFDYNNDGFQDIYVINDKNGSNILYKNNGDLTFEDVSVITSTGIVVDAMSVTIDDYNNDGYFDIYITNTPNDLATPTLGSVLLKNVNGQYFDDVSEETSTLLDGWCWGSNFLDADNDMDLDLYVSCIFTSPDERQSYGFYQNDTLETFSSPENIGFVNNDNESHGSAIGDANNDGKVDIAVINNENIAPNLWINKTENSNNFLTISLEGTASNKDGVGSIIEISINGNKQYRYVCNGEGYISQNSFKEFFGLGTNMTVDYVKVTWLSGIVDTFFNVSANQTLNIVEGSSSTLSTETFDKLNLKIHPNPANDWLLVTANEKIKSIEILNILGQSIDKKYFNSNSVTTDVSFIAAGTYFITVSSEQNIKTLKFIKE
ncbi:FG-GAP-like repeat-containing protein [Winogradskyella litorisediminis]|uniref:FG-GAP-like repeat-containing protein n=1 Tax=Winogradskyella litorisediminis TaxID=1156618 RepID=A0ABW3NAP9_9FLAO